jgi:glycerol-3-phosphate acyltransferase PlsY
MEIFLKAIFFILSYVIGSIPFGVIFAKMKKVDLRKVGSGNIGATNVGRALGWKFAVMTFLLDAFKGFLPAFLGKIIWNSEPMGIIAGLFSFYGHIFSIFLKFKGGKGVATAFGAIMGITPIIGGILFGIWLTAVALTRISAVGALSAAFLAILLSFIWKSSTRLENLMWIIMGATIYITHRENIKHLIKKTEK